jgi:hypothetical protein
MSAAATFVAQLAAADARAVERAAANARAAAAADVRVSELAAEAADFRARAATYAPEEAHAIAERLSRESRVAGTAYADAKMAGAADSRAYGSAEARRESLARCGLEAVGLPHLPRDSDRESTRLGMKVPTTDFYYVARSPAARDACAASARRWTLARRVGVGLTAAACLAGLYLYVAAYGRYVREQAEAAKLGGPPAGASRAAMPHISLKTLKKPAQGP